jgi:hypothetical protein
MDFIPLASTNLAGVALDPDGGDFPLVISFKGGSVYAYPGSQQDVDDLVAAASPGAYFARHIKLRAFRRIG